jgi:uncharacterized phage protein (TIGR02218 family)
VLSQYDNATHTFANTGPPFIRSETKLVRGLQVGTLTLTINARQGIDTVAGVSWPQAAATGVLDGATVCLEKIIAPSFTDMSNGTLIQFLGFVGIAKPTRNAVELEVRSPIDRLQAQFPRNVYQPTCVHTLFDAGCTLAKASFTITGTIAAGSTKRVLNVTVPGMPGPQTGFYSLGTFYITSGPNAGITKTILTHVQATPIVITLQTNLPYQPTVGDAFAITAGCDKTMPTCSTKFSNLQHFRGYPFIPKPEASR